MTYTNDAHTVHTCQTRSVCKPRPPAYIQGPASISTIMSDPRPVFEARPVFKARPLLAHSHYDELMVTLCVFHRNNIRTLAKRLVIGLDWGSE